MPFCFPYFDLRWKFNEQFLINFCSEQYFSAYLIKLLGEHNWIFFSPHVTGCLAEEMSVVIAKLKKKICIVISLLLYLGLMNTVF